MTIFQVVEYWLRRPPGSVNTRADGYDLVGEDAARNRFVEDTGRIREHGYETLPETEGMVGYPPTHRYLIEKKLVDIRSKSYKT